MYFSIIINTHNQYQTFERCIKSCLDQTFKKKYEIIIIDTSNKKFKKNFQLLKSKKIKYFHFKQFSNFPEINQIKKVSKGVSKSKGKWLCLLDGDDFFDKKKLQYIYDNYNLNQKIIIQNNYFFYIEKNKKKSFKQKKFYKKNFFFKKIFNFWPEIYGTSCISGNNLIIKSFFKKTILTKWNFIAIDALLILYAFNKKVIKDCKKLLTFKSVNNNNLSSRYKFNSKLYWKRRNQQIDFWEDLSNNKIYNLDKMLCRLINIF
jgi:glycosyltransferase involved in cell wall biosynthesis